MLTFVPGAHTRPDPHKFTEQEIVNGCNQSVVTVYCKGMWDEVELEDDHIYNDKQCVVRLCTRGFGV